MSTTLSESDIKSMVGEILAGLVGNQKPASASSSSALGGGTLVGEDLIAARVAVPNPSNPAALEAMVAATPARIGEWRAGPRPTHRALLRFRADHAAAMDAVFNDVAADLPEKLGLFTVQSAAPDKASFLMDPNIGARFDAEGAKRLTEGCKRGAQVQIIVSDGLSSIAVEENLPDLLPALTQGLARHGLSVGTNVFVKYGRVRVMDEVTGLLGSEVTLILLGERPGLVTNESLSCYMTYKGYPGVAENVRTVVSNIYRKGTPPAEAGAYIADIVRKMIDTKTSGMDLKL